MTYILVIYELYFYASSLTVTVMIVSTNEYLFIIQETY